MTQAASVDLQRKKGDSRRREGVWLLYFEFTGTENRDKSNMTNFFLWHCSDGLREPEPPADAGTNLCRRYLGGKSANVREQKTDKQTTEAHAVLCYLIGVCECGPHMCSWRVEASSIHFYLILDGVQRHQ